MAISKIGILIVEDENIVAKDIQQSLKKLGYDVLGVCAAGEEAMKQVQGYITKAVIIVVAGILLISAGFIVTQVGALIGANVTFEVPTELGS